MLSGLSPGKSRRKAAPRQVAPLPEDPAAFWGSEKLYTLPKVDLRPPPVDAPLLKQLGRFPFWRGEENLLPALEEVCKAASLAAAAILLRGVRDRPLR